MSSVPRRASSKRRFTVDNLFEDTRPQAVGVSDLVQAKEIRLDRIEPDPDQPRRSFDDERLEELADSIALEGVLQPIAVRYEPELDRYIILHGERRWRASQRAGLQSIPAVVREVPEGRRLIQQLMENVVREDLNALDRAAALRTLKAQMNEAPWEQVAEAVGIKRSRLFQLLGTEKLAEPVQDEIRTGRLSEKQSRVLQGLPGPVQEALTHLIIDEGLGQSEAQRIARAARNDASLSTLDTDSLLERFRAMRGAVEARAPRPSRSSNSSAGELFAQLVEDVDSGMVPDEHGDISADTIDRQVIALASSLIRLESAELTTEERDELKRRLRTLRELIGLTVRTGRSLAD